MSFADWVQFGPFVSEKEVGVCKILIWD